MNALADHFKARSITPAVWFFNTDGALSQFKNRFTMQSLFSFKTRVGADSVVWETCAPGHGKGPWDGIGAVIKRFLRQQEKYNKLNANGPRDVFLALVKHLEEHQNTLRSSGKITTIVYHYILTGDEPAIPGHSNIYSAVKRPALRPVVTDLPGIRSAFCFRVAGEKTLAYRELSCRCSKCLALLWNECKNEDAGEWKRVDMTPPRFQNSGPADNNEYGPSQVSEGSTTW